MIVELYPDVGGDTVIVVIRSPCCGVNFVYLYRRLPNYKKKTEAEKKKSSSSQKREISIFRDSYRFSWRKPILNLVQFFHETAIRITQFKGFILQDIFLV
jgi:hypothetical protein